MEIQHNQIYNEDCLQFMKQLPDNYFDLIITDPPYGINVQHRNCVASRKDNRSKKKINWDKESLNAEHYKEMKRVSKNQIIFGANYQNCFSDKGGAIVWDKLQPLPDSSQCEIASVSSYRKVFKYTQRWTNFVNTKETKHPTEKPIALALWILEKFAKEGDLIFDPFAGSGSFLVACKQKGFKFVGCEINKDYVEIAKNRLAQQSVADFTSATPTLAEPKEFNMGLEVTPSSPPKSNPTDLTSPNPYIKSNLRGRLQSREKLK